VVADNSSSAVALYKLVLLADFESAVGVSSWSSSGFPEGFVVVLVLVVAVLEAALVPDFVFASPH
jgi:hypothetical protein